MDLEYWLWVSMLDLAPNNVIKCLEKYPKQKIWDLKKEDLNRIFTKQEKEKILNTKNKEKLKRYAQYINKNNIKVITIVDAIYPEKLKYIDNPPIVLYILGNLDILNKKSVAIVGSRKCTEYGKKVALNFANLISKKDISIISGLALGIDTNAHIGALKEKGHTIAVTGTGIDLIYPKENEKLFKEIIKNNGLIISEYPLGTIPNAYNFPRRNRIISGLSDGILVIEAKEKSGALITVNYGLEQGKEIYVVPREYYKQ